MYMMLCITDCFLVDNLFMLIFNPIPDKDKSGNFPDQQAGALFILLLDSASFLQPEEFDLIYEYHTP